MSGMKRNFKAKSHILSLLGDELIGSDSLAIFELVKNSYDADAENVAVTFFDLNSDNQKIVIEDDGSGMTQDIIQKVWLTIGTDFKRGKNRKKSDKFQRVSFGNKGVGRLAVHKLAKAITLETQAEGEMFSSRFTIDWKKLINSKEYIQDLEIEIENVGEALFDKGHGTRIILSSLTNTNWTKKSLKDLVRKLENIKNPFQKISNFDIEIKCNDWHQEWLEGVKTPIEILEDSLYQFKFELSTREKGTSEDSLQDLAKFKYSYSFNPPENIPINKNKAENKGTPKNDVFHIGDKFKDIDGEDSNKYLRNKDLENIGPIKGLFYVFNLNSTLLKNNFGGQVTAVKNYIRENCGIKIFRDNIRVYNYGEPNDDWLQLDLAKIQRAGDHFGKKVTIGVIELDLKKSVEGLKEKTNREGFIDNVYFERLQLIVQRAFSFFEQTASQDKGAIDDFIETTKPIKKVGFGETLKELSDKIHTKGLQKELEPLLKRVDKDYTDMRDIMVNSGLAGLNLGVAFHEVEREIKFINVDLSSPKVDIDGVKERIRSLIQILEGLSPILRQNKSKVIDAKKIVEIVKNRNLNRFNYHDIIFSSSLLTGENSNFKFKAPANLIISSLSNIVDNSIYWTISKRDLVGKDYKPAIYIGTDLHTFGAPAIIIVDNGEGFSVEPEYLTQPFKTQKEGGMGLGLYFVDLVMNMIGGKLLFPDSSDLEVPEVYDGACIVLKFPK